MQSEYRIGRVGRNNGGTVYERVFAGSLSHAKRIATTEFFDKGQPSIMVVAIKTKGPIVPVAIREMHTGKWLSI